MNLLLVLLLDQTQQIAGQLHATRNAYTEHYGIDHDPQPTQLLGLQFVDKGQQAVDRHHDEQSRKNYDSNLHIFVVFSRLFLSRRAETTLTALAFGKFLGEFPFDLLVACYDHLRNALARLDAELLVAQID